MITLEFQIWQPLFQYKHVKSPQDLKTPEEKHSWEATPKMEADKLASKYLVRKSPLTAQLLSTAQAQITIDSKTITHYY